MRLLKINKTPNTPGIEFNPETGLLKIEGRSIPENPGEFFENLINWLEEYYSNPAQITQLELFLEYINSGSSKYLLSIFRMIKKKYSEGNNCVVNWYYEEDDEAIQSLGEHFKTSLRIPFNLIEYV